MKYRVSFAADIVMTRAHPEKTCPRHVDAQTQEVKETKKEVDSSDGVRKDVKREVSPCSGPTIEGNGVKERKR